MAKELRHRDDLPSRLTTVLKQRGFVASTLGNKTQVIDARDYDEADYDRWLRELGNFTRRKLLRKIAQGEVAHQELSRICSEPGLSEFLTLLERLGIVEGTGKGDMWRLAKPVDNFGPTLEWHVAGVIAREFEASSEWAVEVEDIDGGGDFDVLAWLETMGLLLYVECKSKEPSSISDSEIRHFMQRTQELAPEIAILLVDTDTTVKPLIERIDQILLPLLRPVRIEDSSASQESFFRDLKVERRSGVFFGQRRIFVTNSMPSLTTQLRKCLRYYSTVVRFQSFLGGPRLTSLAKSRENLNRVHSAGR